MNPTAPSVSASMEEHKHTDDTARTSLEDVKSTNDVADGEKSPQDEEKRSDTDLEQNEPVKPAGPPMAFDPRQNPDGGAKAWSCAAGGFCTLFCSFGLISVSHPAIYVLLLELTYLQIVWVSSKPITKTSPCESMHRVPLHGSRRS